MGWRQDFEDEMRAARGELVDGAKEAMGPWISGLARWDLFGGLTFDPKRVETYLVRVGRKWEVYRRPASWVMPKDMAEGRFWKFVKDAERVLGRRIECVAGLEAHRSGWPHLHPLLSLEGGLQRGDVVQLGALWFEHNGYGRLEAPRSVHDVTAYCAKYLTKDAGHGYLLLKLRTGPEAVRGGVEMPSAEGPAQLASLDGRIPAASDPLAPGETEVSPYLKRGVDKLRSAGVGLRTRVRAKCSDALTIEDSVRGT